MSTLKPHVSLDNSEARHKLQRLLGIPETDGWVIHFPPTGDDSHHPETGDPMGITWWASDCAYVRASIAAWYRDGARGLDALQRERDREFSA